jgi:hypothetical protein
MARYQVREYLRIGDHGDSELFGSRYDWRQMLSDWWHIMDTEPN